jgi:hypothetical protein
MVKVDGSVDMARFAHCHSEHPPYQAEKHGVASPSGRRIMFASNWALQCNPGCGNNGDNGDQQSYVVEFAMESGYALLLTEATVDVGGSAALAGSAIVAVVATVEHTGAAALLGTATVTVVGSVGGEVLGAAIILSSGSVAIVAVMNYAGGASLLGTASLVASGIILAGQALSTPTPLGPFTLLRIRGLILPAIWRRLRFKEPWR